MKVLVDVDGTLCKFRWFGEIWLNFYPFNNLGKTYPNNGVKKTISYISSWFYSWIRTPNKEIIKEIKNLDRKGYTILVFSAVPDIKRQKSVIEKWLRKNKIPFKKIFLMRENEIPAEFKLRVIRKTEPEIIYENDSFIISEILKIFPEIIIRIP